MLPLARLICRRDPAPVPLWTPQAGHAPMPSAAGQCSTSATRLQVARASAYPVRRRGFAIAHIYSPGFGRAARGRRPRCLAREAGSRQSSRRVRFGFTPSLFFHVLLWFRSLFFKALLQRCCTTRGGVTC